MEEKRLIDATKLRKESKMLYSIRAFEPIEGYTQDQIDNAPTIDAAIVVHGEWVCGCNAGRGTEFCYCSECDEDALYDKFGFRELSGFCPNCGAKMDKGEAE